MFFDGLYHPFMLNWGIVYYCSTKVRGLVNSELWHGCGWVGLAFMQEKPVKAGSKGPLPQDDSGCITWGFVPQKDPRSMSRDGRVFCRPSKNDKHDTQAATHYCRAAWRWISACSYLWMYTMSPTAPMEYAPVYWARNHRPVQVCCSTSKLWQASVRHVQVQYSAAANTSIPFRLGVFDVFVIPSLPPEQLPSPETTG